MYMRNRLILNAKLLNNFMFRLVLFYIPIVEIFLGSFFPYYLTTSEIIKVCISQIIKFLKNFGYNNLYFKPFLWRLAGEGQLLDCSFQLFFCNISFFSAVDTYRF